MRKNENKSKFNMEKQERDILFAEFVGATYRHKYGFADQMGYEFSGMPYADDDTYRIWYAQDAMRFHNSWEWIMEVVERIEKLTTEDGRGTVNYIVSIETGYCAISVGGEEVVAEAQQDNDSAENKKEMVCRCCADFIEEWKRANEDKNDEPTIEANS